ASIMEPEPVNAGVYEGVIFYVGDKKGLLTVAYTEAEYVEASSGGFGADTPIGFHGILHDYIGVRGTPVVMDLGAAPEHWNFPVYRFDVESSTAGTIITFTTTIYYANDSVSPDYVGTRVLHKTYEYWFQMDGDEITDSGWGDGIEPPQGAWEILGPGCLNPGIDVAEVRRIATREDDDFAGNTSQETAAAISSGHYATLLGITDDWFAIDLKAGDRVEITGFADSAGMDLTVYPMGDELHFESDGATTIVAAGEDGPCYLRFVPTDESDVPYEFYITHILGWQGLFPLDPLGSWINGIALVSPETESGRIIVSQMDREGLPQGRSFSTSDLYGRLSGTVKEDLGLTLPDQGYLRVDSDEPLWGMQGVTYGSWDLMGCNLVPYGDAAAALFYPQLAYGRWTTYLGMINCGDQAVTVTRQAYNDQGEPLGSDTVVLAPGQKTEDRPGAVEILRSEEAQTMSATVEGGTASLIGYVKLYDDIWGNGLSLKSLIPLDPERASELVIPHIASNRNWQTGIAVMNTGQLASLVTFYGYDADGNLLDESTRTVKAKQHTVGTPATFFPLTPRQEIASIRIVSHADQPLCGWLLYASSSGWQLAGVPIRGASTSIGYAPHIADQTSWGTGICFTNAGETETTVRCSIFSPEGELLLTRDWEDMAPNQKVCGTVRTLFGVDERFGYAKIESLDGGFISGVYLQASADNHKLMGDVIR
ncbi:MAG: hypothetical protein JXI32_05885, partial [Deltaproteobacteria bacterium]|nr:hypothetical protein [Deltaproteobacteria bacterium]